MSTTSGDTTSSSRIKRRSFDIDFKLDAIRFARDHSVRDAANTFNINQREVRSWRKQEQLLHELRTQNATTAFGSTIRMRLAGGGRRKKLNKSVTKLKSSKKPKSHKQKAVAKAVAFKKPSPTKKPAAAATTILVCQPVFSPKLPKPAKKMSTPEPSIQDIGQALHNTEQQIPSENTVPVLARAPVKPAANPIFQPPYILNLMGHDGGENVLLHDAYGNWSQVVSARIYCFMRDEDNPNELLFLGMAKDLDPEDEDQISHELKVTKRAHESSEQQGVLKIIYQLRPRSLTHSPDWPATFAFVLYKHDPSAMQRKSPGTSAGTKSSAKKEKKKKSTAAAGGTTPKSPAPLAGGSATPEKRGRGRPPKSSPGSAQAIVQKIKKRGRGRPPKSASASPAKSATPSSHKKPKTPPAQSAKATTLKVKIKKSTSPEKKKSSPKTKQKAKKPQEPEPSVVDMFYPLPLNAPDVPPEVYRKVTAELHKKEPIRKNTFIDGELVFAKVKGHPWWPSRVITQLEVQQKNKAPNTLYHVRFFATDEEAQILHPNIIPYVDNRQPFAFPRANKSFCKAIYDAEAFLRAYGAVKHIPNPDLQPDTSKATTSRKQKADLQKLAPVPTAKQVVKEAGLPKLGKIDLTAEIPGLTTQIERSPSPEPVDESMDPDLEPEPQFAPDDQGSMGADQDSELRHEDDEPLVLNPEPIDTSY